VDKSPEAFRTISEVAEELDVPQHVLRFWESKFSQIKPMKRGGGRRYYRPHDIELLRGIRYLLYGEGYTIRGVQKILREHGISFVAESGANATMAHPKPRPASDHEGLAPPPQLDPELLKAAQEASGLSQEQVQLLQATLYELSEIRRLLDDAPG
jgi:DNA-binding transcriptional MerR regulator